MEPSWMTERTLALNLKIYVFAAPPAVRKLREYSGRWVVFNTPDTYRHLRPLCLRAETQPLSAL